LKIAILTGYWNPPHFCGGISRVIFELRKVWVKQGHTVHIYAPRTITDAKAGIFHIPIPPLPLRAVSTNLYIRLFVDLSDYDILFPQSLIQALFLNKAKCIPFVHTLSAVEHRIPWRFWRYTIPLIERYAAKNLRTCVVLSSDTGKRLCGQFGFQHASILQCNNGVNYRVFKPYRKRKSADFIVLTAGRFIPRKRFDLLIRAFAGFAKNRPNVKLIVAGEGLLKSKLQKLVKSLCVAHQVSFPGMVDTDGMIDLYRSASIFVFPSSVEGMPMAVLEAQSSALPVIVGDFETANELVVNNSTGVIIGSDDLGKWTKAIERLYEYPVLRHRIGEEARKQIVEHFGWEDVADKMICHFEKAINTNH